MRRFHELPPEDLERLDIGAVNLQCAEGLPGSERIDVGRYVAVLDEWAALVARKTDQMWPRFAHSPAEFNRSEAYFRMLVLVTVLQRDLGVSYATETLENEFDCTDSRLHFLHGILEGRGGTCATMPVLYAAIGRRLGYPLKLVSSVSHLFLRWDNSASGERFNIEATARGMVSHPDKHYRTWPVPLRPEDLAGSYYLSSYSPQQELATFYQTRALSFFDWTEFGKAMQLAHEACRLFPEEPNLQGLHAIATILHRHQSGLESYDRRSGMVYEMNRTRPMESWEQWAINAAAGEIRRLRSIHAKRKPTSPNSTDAAFAAFNA